MSERSAPLPVWLLMAALASVSALGGLWAYRHGGGLLAHSLTLTSVATTVWLLERV